MENPTFDNSNYVQHNCIGHREGDWIIFTCQQCRDYERRINWKTGKMTVRNANDDICHVGSHAPVKAKDQPMSMN